MRMLVKPGPEQKPTFDPPEDVFNSDMHGSLFFIGSVAFTYCVPDTYYLRIWHHDLSRVINFLILCIFYNLSTHIKLICNLLIRFLSSPRTNGVLHVLWLLFYVVM